MSKLCHSGKKHKKHVSKIGKSDNKRDGSISFKTKSLLTQSREGGDAAIPGSLRLNAEENPGVFLGRQEQCQNADYIGMSQGAEGNIVVIGGNGSGKSAGIAMPTLQTWRCSVCATDVKGELSEFYKKQYEQGRVTRPFIVFDPMEATGPGYDPFWWLLEDGKENLFNNIWEIAFAIIPDLPHDDQPFWVKTERGIFAAALLYYFNLGLSFSEAMCEIAETAISSLCKELTKSEDIQVKILLGEAAAMKEEVLAAVDRGLRNKLMLFAADPYISHAFRGEREGANCFSWRDLNNYNIFLRIPANKIEQWGGAINLMYTQLIRHLERRPEQYSAEGKSNVQTLLMMDEFPRFGKLEAITAAMSTLRSKNVNICLMIQSVAQLDRIYGEQERRVIFDNCQYQAILRANDAETQRYLCELVGTCIRRQHSVGEQMDEAQNVTGYNVQISEVREWRVFPYEFSSLRDVLLLTPYGFYRVDKPEPSNALDGQTRLHGFDSTAYQSQRKALSTAFSSVPIPNEIGFKTNEGAKILTIEERSHAASKRAATAKQQQRIEQREMREVQRKKDQRRNYIIGELVSKYFPELLTIEPGSQAENAVQFKPLERFLAELAADRKLVEQIKERAAHYQCGEAGCAEQSVLPEYSDV